MPRHKGAYPWCRPGAERVAARRRAVEAADEGVRVEWRPGAAKTRAADVNGGGARRDNGAR